MIGPDARDKRTASGPGADAARSAASSRFDGVSIAIAIVFGLFYAYDLFEALSNLVELPGFYTSFGLEPVPWGVLIAGVAIPPAAFAIATWVGLRQRYFAKALVYVVGLAAVAASSLSLIALEAELRPPF